MSKRVLALVLAVVGLAIASYLTLYKYGIVGTLACGTGGCEVVQTSRWSTLLGFPVAAWGAAYYAVVLAIAIVGVRERHAGSRALSLLLVAVTGAGLLFSAWLTYLELAVIHAICRYCAGSALVATLLFVVAAFDLYELHLAEAEDDEELEELPERGVRRA